MTLAEGMGDTEKYLDLLMEKALLAIKNNDEAAVELAKDELGILISKAKKHEEASERERVFCSKCTHLVSYEDEYEDWCSHPNNTELVSNWKSRHVDYINEPKELNKDGDCKWFEPIKPFSIEAWIKGFFTK